MFTALAVAFLIAGCSTSKPSGATKATPDEKKVATNAVTTAAAPVAATNEDAEQLTLREGDVLKITFPGASPSLNGDHVISRDGFISMNLIGEIKAAGKSVPDLKADLLKAYSGQIDTKEINIELVSSAFPVYVTGAVLQPGKVMSDHPMTALEAIMERGGFDYTKADLKDVRVLRQEPAGLKTYHLNMKKVLSGKEGVQFYLKPSDIVYVPERFVWF